jgi:hypothetical protein
MVSEALENNKTMEEFKEYSKAKWEEIGLLEATPEDRKDKVVHALNLILKAIIENTIHSDEGMFETMSVPIVVRIINAVDVPDEDISRLAYRIREEFKKFSSTHDLSEFHLNIDYEAMFSCEFADQLITEYKNKQQ